MSLEIKFSPFNVAIRGRRMDDKFGLKAELLKEIIDIAKKYDVHKVIIYGSRARGDYKERSDIDLAFEGGRASEFALEVDEDTNTLLQFDIVNLNDPVQQELRKSIHDEGIVIYEKV